MLRGDNRCVRRCSTKITFGAFFRNTPATIMRCGRTFRLARTHPVRARSSGSETLSRSRSLAGYTIDTHESEFSEATRKQLGGYVSNARSLNKSCLWSARKRWIYGGAETEKA